MKTFFPKKKQEVDFLTLSKTGDFALYQVCYDMSDPDTRKRELQSLTSALQEMARKEGFVITEDHGETVQSEGITIHVIPFWKWAIAESGLKL